MKIKEKPSDFIVEEISEGGKIFSINYSLGERIKDLFFIFKKSKKYVHATLVKKNITTVGAIKAIADKLHISIKRIGIAGNKDKKAIASQRISIYIGQRGSQHKQITKRLLRMKHKNFFLKNFNYSDDGIGLGKLKGNKFKIIVRSNKNEIKRLKHLIMKLKKQKILVPNFFDYQRFGKTKKNHKVGKEIINGKFNNAVRLILLSYGDKESKEIKDIKNFIRENFGAWNIIKNFIYKKIESKKYLKEKLIQELLIINHLCKFRNDYVNALRKVPKKILRIYIHAYQSFLFNLMLSKLLKTHLGNKDKDNLKLPLIGYKTEKMITHINNEIKKLIFDVINVEGVSFDMFKIKSMPELSEKGKLRNAFFRVNNFNVKIKNDFLEMSFWIDKGSYATTFLNLIFDKMGPPGFEPGTFAL